MDKLIENIARTAERSFEAMAQRLNTRNPAGAIDTPKTKPAQQAEGPVEVAMEEDMLDFADLCCNITRLRRCLSGCGRVRSCQERCADSHCWDC